MKELLILEKKISQIENIAKWDFVAVKPVGKRKLNWYMIFMGINTKPGIKTAVQQK